MEIDVCLTCVVRITNCLTWRKIEDNFRNGRLGSQTALWLEINLMKPVLIKLQNSYVIRLF